MIFIDGHRLQLAQENLAAGRSGSCACVYWELAWSVFLINEGERGRKMIRPRHLVAWPGHALSPPSLPRLAVPIPAIYGQA